MKAKVTRILELVELQTADRLYFEESARANFFEAVEVLAIAEAKANIQPPARGADDLGPESWPQNNWEDAA